MKNFDEMRKVALEKMIEQKIENVYEYYEDGVRKHDWTYEYTDRMIEKNLEEIKKFYEHHYEKSVEES